ncbi:MAG: Crp/Fnr family transcriptional regulator [Alphaproteobacteria bacterium]
MAESLYFVGQNLMQALNESQQQALLAATEMRRFQDGETIQNRGDTNLGLNIVREGVVQFGNFTLDGNYYTTAIVGPGFSFGEFTLFAGLPRTHHAQAVGGTVIDHVTKPAFEKVMDKEVGLRRALLSVVTRQLHTALEILEDMRALPLDVRVAKLLSTALQPEATRIDITQDTLASAMGVTRASINAALGRLQKQGILQRAYGGVEIASPSVLQDWVAERTQLEPLAQV